MATSEDQEKGSTASTIESGEEFAALEAEIKEEVGGAPESPDSAEAQADDEDIADVLQATCEVVAGWRGPHWALERGEALTVARPLGKVLRKWAPFLLNAAGPEIACLIAVVTVFGPRLREDRALQGEVVEEADAKT